jgi:Tfp pilus assembly PilM family ATPase
MVGAVARFPGVAQLLSKDLALPVEVLDPLSAFSHSLSEKAAAELSPLCGVAVAVGLALRGVPGPNV